MVTSRVVGRRRAVAAVRPAEVLIATGTAVVALATGVALASGGTKLALVLPVGALAGVLLLSLAVTRFELFTLVVLAIRASLDVAKVGGGAGLDVTSLVGILFVGAGTLWLILQRHDGWRPRALGMATLGLLAAAVLSVVGSADRVASALEVGRMAAMVTMVLVLERLLVDRTVFRQVLVVVYLAAVVPLAVAVFQLVTGTGTVIGAFTRVNGTFLHPNPLAMFLTFLLVMGVALLPYLDDRWRSRLISILFVTTLVLFGTYMRAAWIAAVLGVVVVGFLQRNRIVVGMTVALVLVGLVLVPSTAARFSDLFTDTRTAGAADNSLAWRLDYWTDALALAEDNPLTGIGLKGVASGLEEGVQPHNDYLRALVELGAVGLLAYVGWLVTMIAIARGALRRVTSGLERGVAVGFTGCLAAFVLLSVTSNVISQNVVVWYFVAFAALSQAVGRVRQPRSAVR